MPTFDFKCGVCGFCFEVFLRTSEEVGDCPKCSSPSLQRVFSFSQSLLNPTIEERKIGDLTREKIEEARQDLKEMKEKLKERREWVKP